MGAVWTGALVIISSVTLTLVVQFFLRCGFWATPTTDQVFRAKAKTVTSQVDWQLVRLREYAIYHKYFHRLDGTCVLEGFRATDELGAEPVEDEAPLARAVEYIAGSGFGKRRCAEIRVEGMRELEDLDQESCRYPYQRDQESCRYPYQSIVSLETGIPERDLMRMRGTEYWPICDKVLGRR